MTALTSTRTPGEKTRRWPQRLHRVVLTIVATVAVGLLGSAVLVPAIMGWVPLTVLTGSMEPYLRPGTLVVVQPLDGAHGAQQVHPGDVVAFLPNLDDATTVLHRVVAINIAGDGQRTLTTKGDANNAPDARPITHQQLRGKEVYHLPLVGYATRLLPGSAKLVGAYVLAGVLAVYAIYQFYRAVQERRR